MEEVEKEEEEEEGGGSGQCLLWQPGPGPVSLPSGPPMGGPALRPAFYIKCVSHHHSLLDAGPLLAPAW